LLEFPPDTPHWLRAAVSDLKKQELGCHFDSLLYALLRLEAAYEFDNPKRGLMADKRPGEIQQWIRGGRRGRSRTNIVIETSKLEGYATKWQEWWDSMQPDWRKRGVDGRWRIDGEYGYSWDDLDFPGQNGCLSVAAGLYFWGCALEGEEGGTLEQWNHAVQDVSWMLEGLLYSLVPVKGQKNKK
jgi:hypothetical protein